MTSQLSEGNLSKRTPNVNSFHVIKMTTQCIDSVLENSLTF